MYSQAARLCFVVVVLVVICAANPVGKPKKSSVDEPHPTKDVFKDVAKILHGTKHESKKDSSVSRKKGNKELGVKTRHHKHKRHNPREQMMLKDVPSWGQSDAGARTRQTREWRHEWNAPQPTPYNMYPYSPQVPQVPQTYEKQYYISHPYYNYPYSGYTNWYANQMPNYNAYNLPPEREWKTTVHEAPDVEWTAHIAIPDMEPIIITNKNYSSHKSNVKVIINKSEPENGRGVDTRHVPIPGPRPVDPNSRSLNHYLHSPLIVPNEKGKNKNKHNAMYEPVTWTAQIDYPYAPPVVYKGSSPQLNYPQHQVQYVNTPPPMSGQGYYYPYNPAPPQWPAPAYNNVPWVSAPPYHTFGNPSLTNQWPSVQVSYPNVNTNNVPQYYTPSQPIEMPTYTSSQYPSYEIKPVVKADTKPLSNDDDDDDDNGDDDDDDDDDVGEDDDLKDNDVKKDKDGDGGNDESDENDKEEDQEPTSEAEDYEDVTAAPDSDEEDVETTTKKGLFSWG